MLASPRARSSMTDTQTGHAEGVVEVDAPQRGRNDGGAAREPPQAWEELDPEMLKTLSSFGLEARIDKYKGRCVSQCAIPRSRYQTEGAVHNEDAKCAESEECVAWWRMMGVTNRDDHDKYFGSWCV